MSNPAHPELSQTPLSRRAFLGATASLALGGLGRRPVAADLAPTEFQIACMTYVYRAYPLQRALEGIARSGYRYVAWGTEHLEEDGRKVPVLAPDAPASEARK